MELRWRDSVDTGYSELDLIDDDGNAVPDSHLWVRDFSADSYRWPSREMMKPDSIVFKWEWCNGWVHCEEHLLKEGLTMDHVKREAEEWLLQHYVESYDAALARAHELAGIAEWARSRICDE